MCSYPLSQETNSRFDTLPKRTRRPLLWKGGVGGSVEIFCVYNFEV